LLLTNTADTIIAYLRLPAYLLASYIQYLYHHTKKDLYMWLIFMV